MQGRNRDCEMKRIKVTRTSIIRERTSLLFNFSIALGTTDSGVTRSLIVRLQPIGKQDRKASLTGKV